jgi:hypothetical protein
MDWQEYGLASCRVETMAKNTGSGHRKGAIRNRSQTKSTSGNYVKRDGKTGRFLNVKSDKSPFKGIRREK